MSADREHSRDRDRSRRGNDRSNRFSDVSRDRSMDRGKDRGGMKSSNCRVYVSNIPYEYRWQDLKDLFRDQVGEVAFVELFVDENDKPRGCGIVEFSDPMSVKKCLDSMHRFELKGRKIVIKEDFGNQRDKFGNLMGGKRGRDRDDSRDNRRDDRRRGFDNSGPQNMGPPMGGGGSSNIDWGNTYGLSPAFLQELCIDGPLIKKVFIANLDYKVDKKKLKEVFRMAGKVQSVDVPTDKEGQRRGFAVIEFDHPVESVQAISMFHNQPLYDRIMTVRMDREREKVPDGLKTIGPGLGSNGEPLKDVARNLPSLQNNSSQNVNNAPGILGAVPNLQGLGTNALSALGNLSSTSAVLQAANLAGVGGLSNNLLGNALGNNALTSNDLNLAANLVQNNQSLAALSSNNLSSSSGNQSSFLSTQNPAFSTNQTNLNSLSGSASNLTRNYQSYNDSKSSFNNFGGGNTNRPNENRNNNLFSGVGTGSNQNQNQMMRNQPKTNYSKKILISNLPPSASFKMLGDKCQEFGTVEDIQEQGVGSLAVTFHTEWEAERAIKNMDRARIDGRTIDVRFF